MVNLSRFSPALALVFFLPTIGTAQTGVPTEAIVTAVDTVHATLLVGDLAGEGSERAIHGEWREEASFGGPVGAVPQELVASLGASILEWDAASICDGGPESCRMREVPVIFRVGYRTEASDRVTVRLDARYRTNSSRVPVARRSVDVLLTRTGAGWAVAELRTRSVT